MSGKDNGPEASRDPSWNIDTVAKQDFREACVAAPENVGCHGSDRIQGALSAVDSEKGPLSPREGHCLHRLVPDCSPLSQRLRVFWATPNSWTNPKKIATCVDSVSSLPAGAKINDAGMGPRPRGPPEGGNHAIERPYKKLPPRLRWRTALGHALA